MIISSYLHPIFNPKKLTATVNTLAKLIKDSKIKFTSIAFRGMSGSIIAPAVAIKLKKEIVLIRKSDDDCHSSDDVEGRSNIKSYIIIDDRIASGDTVRSIIKNMNKFTDNKAKLKAVFLYYHNGSETQADLQGFIRSKVPVKKLRNV